MSPDENLVVPPTEYKVDKDGKFILTKKGAKSRVRRKPGWNPAMLGFVVHPGAKGRKRKRAKI